MQFSRVALSSGTVRQHTPAARAATRSAQDPRGRGRAQAGFWQYLWRDWLGSLSVLDRAVEAWLRLRS